jgi:membrane protease YdiL (CAAX protease family)
MLSASEIISTILQILVFTTIPFVVYLVTNRRVKGFLDYVGLRKPETRPMIYAAVCAVAFVVPALLLVFFSPAILEAATAPNTVIGKLRANGLSVTTSILLIVKALIQTAFTEEILFLRFCRKAINKLVGFYRRQFVAGAFIRGSAFIDFRRAGIFIGFSNRNSFIFGNRRLDYGLFERASWKRFDFTELADARTR